MKTLYILGGLVLVTAIGIGGFLATRTKDVVTNDMAEVAVGENKNETPAVALETLTGSDTFANLFRLGKTLECSFTFRGEDVGTTGTGFFDGKNMRVDSMYQGDGRATYTSNMISDGTTMYLWSKTADGMMAMKMAVPKDGVTSNTEPADQSKEGLNPQSKVTYDCKPWNVDGSVFVPPAEIDFMDMSAMQNNMMGGSGMPVPAGNQ